MSENFNDEDNAAEEEDFAKLFESYADMIHPDLKVGDKVKGKIIAIGEDDVFVDTGAKIDGVVDKTELMDEQGKMTCREGDRIELYVVSMDEVEIKLSRALSGIGGLNILREAYAAATPVEGKVLQTCKGGFHVNVLQRRAFCPVSQIDIKHVDTTDAYVGKTYHFIITRFDDHGKNIVVSRRELLQQEQKEAAEQFCRKLTLGSVLDGRVTRLMPYGAFVELAPGVEGMVHISELSWSRLEKPDDAVSGGDTISVKIIGIQTNDAIFPPKISLSVKQMQSDPWDTAGNRFKIGHKVTGKVTRCVKFGAFVEIAPGIEGLVHISEMSYIKRILNPADVVSPGQTVSVMVKDSDPVNRRISLSLRDAEGDPWLNVEKYGVGKAFEGTLEKKENFGYFITLEPGVTGLLPKSNISKAARPQTIEKLKEGDTIKVIIEKVSTADRKITLGPADLADEGDWKNYVQGNKKTTGSLAEKLKQALDTKND